MNLVSHFNVPQKLLEAAILSNDLRKEHIVNQVITKIAGQKNPLVGIYGIPKKYSPLIDIIRRFKEKSVNVLIYSSGHEYKKYEGYEVTDSLPRFVVDTTIILSEEELPIEFTHLDKVYLK